MQQMVRRLCVTLRRRGRLYVSLPFSFATFMYETQNFFYTLPVSRGFLVLFSGTSERSQVKTILFQGLW